MRIIRTMPRKESPFPQCFSPPTGAGNSEMVGVREKGAQNPMGRHHLNALVPLLPLGVPCSGRSRSSGEGRETPSAIRGQTRHAKGLAEEQQEKPKGSVRNERRRGSSSRIKALSSQILGHLGRSRAGDSAERQLHAQELSQLCQGRVVSRRGLKMKIQSTEKSVQEQSPGTGGAGRAGAATSL